MRIGIIGAGAIGGWLGVRLAGAGHDISVLARGATLAALTGGDWRLEANGQVHLAKVRARESAVDLGVQDLLIIALKAPALLHVAPLLSPMIGPETQVLPAMNGVPWWFLLGGGGDLAPTSLTSIDPGGVIAQSIPFRQVVGAVVHASVSAPAPATIKHKAGNRLILGRPVGGTDGLGPIAAVFESAGLDLELAQNIRREIWYKLWGNMTMNPISAFTGATCDRLLDDPLVADFVLRVMAEAQAIGNRIGCPIVERGEDRNGITRQLGAFKTSMLQDAEAGRPMEIDVLLSAPRQIAEQLGIQTPNLDALLGLTRLFAGSNGLYGQPIAG